MSEDRWKMHKSVAAWCLLVWLNIAAGQLLLGSDLVESALKSVWNSGAPAIVKELMP